MRWQTHKRRLQPIVDSFVNVLVGDTWWQRHVLLNSHFKSLGVHIKKCKCGPWKHIVWKRFRVGLCYTLLLKVYFFHCLLWLENIIAGNSFWLKDGWIVLLAHKKKALVDIVAECSSLCTMPFLMVSRDATLHFSSACPMQVYLHTALMLWLHCFEFLMFIIVFLLLFNP